MRFFLFVFSFYLLALSAIPCSDMDNCYLENKSFYSSATNSRHDEGAENCPPFCNCSCCGQTCNDACPSAEISFIIPFVLKSFMEYKNPSFSEVYLSIWQPPKIC